MAGDRWIEIGHLDDIPRRGARQVRRSPLAFAIAVFRTAEDEVFALVDRCPHRGGPLSAGIVHDCAVACPLHGWVIRLDSGEAEAPDQGCVPRIAVRLAEGRIWLSASGIEAAAGLDRERV